jgi:hypothetical protein
MAYENEKLQIPTAEENTQVEETNLQIEELESRVAPNTVWGT